MATSVMSESGRKILHFLQKNPKQEFTKRQLVIELDLSMPAVTGNINSFMKKKFVVERVNEWTDEAHHIHVDRYYTLTKEGKDFDPDMADRALAEAKLKAAALRKYERIQQRKHGYEIE